MTFSSAVSEGSNWEGLEDEAEQPAAQAARWSSRAHSAFRRQGGLPAALVPFPEPGEQAEQG